MSSSSPVINSLHRGDMRSQLAFTAAGQPAKGRGRPSCIINKLQFEGFSLTWLTTCDHTFSLEAVADRSVSTEISQAELPLWGTLRDRVVQKWIRTGRLFLTALLLL